MVPNVSGIIPVDVLTVLTVGVLDPFVSVLVFVSIVIDEPHVELSIILSFVVDSSSNGTQVHQIPSTVVRGVQVVDLAIDLFIANGSTRCFLLDQRSAGLVCSNYPSTNYEVVITVFHP